MDLRISQALQRNVNYSQGGSLGVPASALDDKVFYDQASFLKDSPLLRVYVHNPNHIGCHTLGESEAFFSGTQELEKEVIELLCVDMLHARPGSSDGYVASGGTEANLQAVWIYRNYFEKENKAERHQIALLASEDTHYSVAKAAGIFGLDLLTVPVCFETRQLQPDKLSEMVRQAKAAGKAYFIIVANMATTIFGSVDDPAMYTAVMEKEGCAFKMHVDGAFGGFIYPISDPDNPLDFRNLAVSSITLDAHKMLQAPYGTGIFLVRKNLMEYVYTREAQYVNGMDITLCGSRSGASAIAVWMILQSYGYYGWQEKIHMLLSRTNYCCNRLEALGVRHYRHPRLNIITLRAADLPAWIAEKYFLVPDRHGEGAQWYKIVVMDHVDHERLNAFLEDVEASKKTINEGNKG